CNNTRLRKLRKKTRELLKLLTQYKLKHIDRLANQHADRLANQGLDTRRTNTVCSDHGRNGSLCCSPASSLTSPTEAPDQVDSMSDVSSDDDQAMLDEAETAQRTDGAVFPSYTIGPDCVPQRRSRLQLRQLGDEEDEAARLAVDALAAKFADQIAEADDWDTGEGLLSALTSQLYMTLIPFCKRTARPRPPHTPSQPRRPRDHRPRRVTLAPVHHALDQALDDLAAAQRAPQASQRTISKARRRAGRVRNALRRTRTRKRFETNERACMQQILPSAGAASDNTSAATRCPIPRDELQRYFEGTNTPRRTFDFDDPTGVVFRQLLESLPPAINATDAFSSDITEDEVEDQLQRANSRSSPGIDGIAYDVLKRFRSEITPALHAAYSFCWKHRKVPSTWKVGTTQLIYKKGDPKDPSNWRPICLQPCVYKLYSGIMARRLTRWADANDRLTNAQKGFRHFNGCNEHNFVSSSVLDQTRRKPREMHMVWYDLRNAFGSIPPLLMWHVLRKIGVDTAFVERCEN
ncbi:reverse transcriptase, partial [Globisporangium polare]